MATPEAADRVYLFGCPFDRVDMAEAIRRVEGYIAKRDRVYQSCGVNLDQLLKMQREPEFARIVRSCDLITADGTPVIWFSKMFGDPLPERVPSVDIKSLARLPARRRDWCCSGSSSSPSHRAHRMLQGSFPSQNLRRFAEVQGETGSRLTI